MRGLNRVLAGTLSTGLMAASGTALAHGYQDDPGNIMETPSADTVVDFGAEGQFVISAQRVTGLAWTNAKVHNPGGSLQYSFTDAELSFFGGPNQNQFAVQVASPQIVADYFVIKDLSVGIGIAFIMGKPKWTDLGVDNVNDQEFGFTGSGRVGYAFNAGDVVTIWPHVGVSGAYTKFDHKVGETATEKLRSTALWFTADVTILARIGEGYGITFLPEVAVPLLGHTNDSQSVRLNDYTAYVVGGTFGLSVWF